MTVRPDLRMERALLRSGARVVVGMDEVGRGALAGPVTVGAVAVDLATRTCPQGVADSKLLTAAARERLLPALGRWGVARGVGHAGPDEIDRLGIIAALRLAGRRAVAALGIEVDLVLLDGSHDWLTTPAELDLFGEDAPAAVDPWSRIAVRTRVKADQRCASVAAASILAKCRRDALMRAHAEDHPAFGWAENKGYGAPEHVEALRRLGPSPLHRTSWRLPTAGDGVADELADELDDAVDEPADVDGRLDGVVVGAATGGTDATDDADASGVPDADERHGWAMMDA